VARTIFKELMQCVSYLHEKSVCHRDIKPSNIMVYDCCESKIKLTDFNVAKLCTNERFEMLTHTGTEAFTAPEMFTRAIYNEKVDIWSAGCVLYTMLSGYQPFYHEK